MSLHPKLLHIDHPLTFEESKLRQIEAHALIYLSIISMLCNLALFIEHIVFKLHSRHKMIWIISIGVRFASKLCSVIFRRAVQHECFFQKSREIQESRRDFCRRDLGKISPRFWPPRFRDLGGILGTIYKGISPRSRLDPKISAVKILPRISPRYSLDLSENFVRGKLTKFYSGFAVFAIFQDDLEARTSLKAFFSQPIG